MQPQRPVPRKAPARASEPRAKGAPTPESPDVAGGARRLLPEGSGAGLPLVLLGVLGFVAGAIFEQATSGQPSARADDPAQPAIPNIPAIAPPPLAQPAIAAPGAPIVPPSPPVHPAVPDAPAGTEAPAPAAAAVPAVPAAAPTQPPAATAVPADAAAQAPAAAPMPAAEPIQYLDSPRKVGPREETGRAPGPRTEEPPQSPFSSLMRLLLVAVLLGAGLVAWFVVRRRGTGLGGLGGRDQLQVIGTTRVGGRFLVALVRVPGRTLVVGASDKGLSLLSEIRDAGDDQLEALPDGVVRDAQGLLGAAPEAPRGLGDGGARGRGGAPFDNLLSEMLRGGQGAGYGPSVGAAPGGAEPGPRGGQSPLESPEARALRARLQRQQPSP